MPTEIAIAQLLASQSDRHIRIYARHANQCIGTCWAMLCLSELSNQLRRSTPIMRRQMGETIVENWSSCWGSHAARYVKRVLLEALVGVGRWMGETDLVCAVVNCLPIACP